MITLITGKQASGKSHKADELTRGKKTYHVNANNSDLLMICTNIQPGAALVIDNVVRFNQVEFLFGEHLARLRSAVDIYMCSQTLTHKDFKGNKLNVINL